MVLVSYDVYSCATGEGTGSGRFRQGKMTVYCIHAPFEGLHDIIQQWIRM
jgi:hypothetical protein